MATEAVVVFYGVRYAVDDNNIELLESRSDPRLIAARKHGLKYYWGNFAGPQSRYLLFIGDKLGIVGIENDREIQVTPNVLTERMRHTESKLRDAGISEAPQLFIQWQPA